MIHINWIGELLDTIVSISGKYGRWLNIKGKRICFIIWALCATYWAFRDFYLNLWSQGFFCLFSVGLNMYGFFEWKRKMFGEKGEEDELETKD